MPRTMHVNKPGSLKEAKLNRKAVFDAFVQANYLNHSMGAKELKQYRDRAIKNKINMKKVLKELGEIIQREEQPVPLRCNDEVTTIQPPEEINNSAPDSEFECLICADLLYEPCAYPCCGCLCCKNCIQLYMYTYKNNACPHCREQLSKEPSMIRSLQGHLFSIKPSEMGKRKAEVEAARAAPPPIPSRTFMPWGEYSDFGTLRRAGDYE
jgi:hypothetical protein